MFVKPSYVSLEHDGAPVGRRPSPRREMVVVTVVGILMMEVVPALSSEARCHPPPYSPHDGGGPSPSWRRGRGGGGGGEWVEHGVGEVLLCRHGGPMLLPLGRGVGGGPTANEQSGMTVFFYYITFLSYAIAKTLRNRLLMSKKASLPLKL